MEAIVGVWVFSVLGAAAFSAAGYAYGQHSPRKVSPSRPAKVEPPPVLEAESTDRPTAPLPLPAARASEAPVAKLTEPDEPEPEDPATEPATEPATSVVYLPEAGSHGSSSEATVPRASLVDHDSQRVATAELIRDALAQVESAVERTRALDVLRSKLEREVESLRAELRGEVVARTQAETQVEEIGDRLARASEETASLRHKASMLDKQNKQLREALQGRVRALNTSESQRRRELDEAEDVREKLRDVYEKIERSSLPPSSVRASSGPGSMKPAPPARSLGPASDDTAVLREEIARLARENRELRARTIGGPTAKQRRPTLGDLDLDVYRGVMVRLGNVTGLQGAVLADDVGSLLVGSGELAEGLAAFGAYLRDASSRTDRILPLDAVDEVDLRDRAGMMLSTRVLPHDGADLSFVFLANDEAAFTAAKNVIETTLRLR